MVEGSSQTRPTPETVKVSFTGENESWIAGSAARVFHTTDGATWDIQAHPPRQPMLRARYNPPEAACVRQTGACQGQADMTLVSLGQSNTYEIRGPSAPDRSATHLGISSSPYAVRGISFGC